MIFGTEVVKDIKIERKELIVKTGRKLIYELMIHRLSTTDQIKYIKDGNLSLGKLHNSLPNTITSKAEIVNLIDNVFLEVNHWEWITKFVQKGMKSLNSQKT